MSFLALDTAMAACSAAVYDDFREAALAAAFVPMERGHGEALAPMIDDVMKRAGRDFAGLEAIAVTLGPGTFTGLRIGLAMAKGLALALGRPIHAIDTLSAIAANAGDTAEPLLVACEARDGLVYAAMYRNRVAAREPRLMTPAEAAAMAGGAPAFVLGNAAEKLAAHGPGNLTRSRAGVFPDAARFAALAFSRPPSPEPLAPLYLRPPDAKPQAIRRAGEVPLAIREAGQEDAPLLADLHAESFDNPWTASEFSRLCAMPGAMCLIADEDGEPVGFALMRSAAGEAEIVTIATRPFARRHGVARRLLLDIVARLGACGAKDLFIEVARSNDAAMALYRALGFAAAGLRRGYYLRPEGVREDAILMRRPI